jgi:hypothetical protein
MNFSRWLAESTQAELHDSSVRAFPKTRYRQHVVDQIEIDQLEWTPYLGVKTLFISAQAHNTVKGTDYRPMILFKGVNYGRPGTGLFEIVADDKRYAFERFESGGTDLMLRCNCPDFQWRFNYYDWVDGSLFGNKRKKYDGSGAAVNPAEMSGMCKHLMALFKTLGESGAIF